jgi:hypothetical protein
MMSKVYEDTVGGMVAPVQAGDIAYLPGGFTSMRNSIRSLSVFKHKWNIDVLEEGDGYGIYFEKDLRITVPKSAYEEFNNKVLKVHGVKQIDLSRLINEATEELAGQLYAKISRLLSVDLKIEDPMAKTLMTIHGWQRAFPRSRFIPTSNVAISMENFDRDVEKLMQKLHRIYKDEVGNLQILIKDLEDRRAMSTAKPFSSYAYLAGSKVHTNYEGVEMILEAYVDKTMIPSQKITIDDEAVVDEVEGLRTSKAVGNTIYPNGLVFTAGFFAGIKEVIDGMEV